jgi:hypothetical protein
LDSMNMAQEQFKDFINILQKFNSVNNRWRN